MTTEHKILRLIDGGIIDIVDICVLIGSGAKGEGKRMRDKGFMEWTVSPYMKLTTAGLGRLNELDGVVG